MIQVVIIWGLIVLFIFQPGIAHFGAEKGARLFATALLPYLLPYIILTQWLVKSSSDRIQSSWKRPLKAYLLSSFGGFPIGAVTLAEMQKKNDLSKKQSNLLLAICHAPSPMFILGFVGNGIFNDSAIGWKLLLAIHLSNLLFFAFYLLLFRPSFRQQTPSSPSVAHPKEASPLLAAIKQSTDVILLVATTVIFFSALGIVLANLVAITFSVDTGITQTILLAIFEMTAGIESASVHFHTVPYFPYLVAAMISLNGISIHMQIAVIAKAANLSVKLYILARMWNVVCVPFIFYLFIS